MDFTNIKQKGGYNIAKVFGQNYFKIIDEIYSAGNLSKKFYEEHKKKLMVEHIKYYYFDFKDEYRFISDGYFKYLMPIYSKHLYFYTQYIQSIFYKIFKSFIGKLIRIKKDRRDIIIRVLGIKISFKRQKRKNTFYTLKQNSSKIEIGRYTYGTIDADINETDSSELSIGDFCSIAPEVKFILSVEHQYNGISTYPFETYFLNEEGESISKGDIVIKDDVWIG